MSHSKERKERNCLNCNAHLNGRYCHICGQENIETSETVWQLVTHFFYDLTHFDGKFFSTLKYLVFNPGFLSAEYMEGRRASYLNPVRMYIFTSAIFFFVFFLIDPAKNLVKQTYKTVPVDEIKKMDSTEFAAAARKYNFELKTSDEVLRYVDSSWNARNDTVRIFGFKSGASYDSALAKGKLSDSYIKQKLIHRAFDLRDKYKNANSFSAAVTEDFVHRLPQIFFISLPLFAMILKLLYLRRNQFLYTNHLIFTFHFYIFIFICGLVLLGLSELSETSSFLSGAADFLTTVTWISMFVYPVFALRFFYRQNWIKTLLKYLLLLFIMAIILVLLFFIFLFISIYNI